MNQFLKFTRVDDLAVQLKSLILKLSVCNVEARVHQWSPIYSSMSGLLWMLCQQQFQGYFPKLIMT